jgi:hypothetical protein
MRFPLNSDLYLEYLREPWQPPELDVGVVTLGGDIDRAAV